MADNTENALAKLAEEGDNAMGNDTDHLSHDTHVQTSRLMSLPRELRDKIFVAAATDTDMSPSTWQQSRLVVRSHLPPALLRVNKQMRDECTEHNRRHGNMITTFQPQCDNPNDLLQSLRKFSRAVLKSICACLVMVPSEVLGALGAAIDRLAFEFHMDHAQDFDQTELLWTPSKALRQVVMKLTRIITQHMNAEPYFEVRFDVTQLTYDDGTSTQLYRHAMDTGRHISKPRRSRHLLHLPTLLEMDTGDPSQFGEFHINFELTTPLYCMQSTNAAEVKAAEQAFKRGETDKLVAPDCELSKEIVRWRPIASTDPYAIHGLFPVFHSIDLACDADRIHFGMDSARDRLTSTVARDLGELLASMDDLRLLRNSLRR